MSRLTSFDMYDFMYSKCKFGQQKRGQAKTQPTQPLAMAMHGGPARN